MKYGFNLKQEELDWYNWHWRIQESQTSGSVIPDIFSFFLIPSLCLRGMQQLSLLFWCQKAFLEKVVAW